MTTLTSSLMPDYFPQLRWLALARLEQLLGSLHLRPTTLARHQQRWWQRH
jgi:hypothetical protein